jgi:hypothetical protein
LNTDTTPSDNPRNSKRNYPINSVAHPHPESP